MSKHPIRFPVAFALAWLVGSIHSVFADDLQTLSGSWSWPDQGISWFREGDPVKAALVYDLITYDGRLIVGGAFMFAGGARAPHLAAWDGEIWSVLGNASPDGPVERLLCVNDLLYVIGSFQNIGSVSAKGIAVWNGESWTALGAGVSGPEALAWGDDGNGDALFVATGLGVRKWNGATWSVILSGTSVSTLAFFDHGAGPRLYTGSWTGIVRRWDGSQWSIIGEAYNGYVDDMVVFDDGAGPDLYVSGDYNGMDFVPAVNLARWNGTNWSVVENRLYPFDSIYRLRVLDDGSGPALYTIAGRIHKWDGKVWTRLLPAVGALAAEMFDGPSGPVLHAGGAIELDDVYTNIARFVPDNAGAGCGDFDGSGMVDQVDLGILLAHFGCDKQSVECPGDTDADGDVDQSDLGVLLLYFGGACR